LANRLLAALPPVERQCLLAHCEWVELASPLPLDSGHAAQRHAYFPVDCTISVLAPDGERRGVEVGAVGSEGLFGPGALSDAGSCQLHGLVQGAGHAWRVEAGTLDHLAGRHHGLDGLLSRYVRVMLVQTARSVACCRFHSLEQRLARWLLAHTDRSWSTQLSVTHDLLALMLGARRAGVTVAAGMLEDRGLISARRGQLTVLDRDGLLRSACGCYLRDRQTYEEGMGVPPARRRY
jgi:CRP-like cAMP-binding protein